MAFDDYLGAERKRIQDQQQPQAPAYMFRDDRNADLDRAQGAQTAAMGVAAKAAGPFAPAKPGSGFDSFSKDLEAGAPSAAKATGSNPFAPADTKGQVSGAISRLLSNPTGGFDQQASLARQGAVKKDQQANEDLRGAAALQFLPGTGQAFAPMQQQTDAQRLGMRDLDLQIAGQRADAEQQGLQAGVSAGLQQEGQRLSAEQAAAQLKETIRQFNETIPIQAANAKVAADIGYGNLGVAKGTLDLNTELGRGQIGLGTRAADTADARLNLDDKLGTRAADLGDKRLGLDEKLGFAGLDTQKEIAALSASTQTNIAKLNIIAAQDLKKIDAAANNASDLLKMGYTVGEDGKMQGIYDVAVIDDDGRIVGSRKGGLAEYTTNIQSHNNYLDRLHDKTMADINNSALDDRQLLSMGYTRGEDGKPRGMFEVETTDAMGNVIGTRSGGLSEYTASSEEKINRLRQAFNAAESDKDRSQIQQKIDNENNYNIAALAQTDKHFGEKMGLDWATLDAHKDEFRQTFTQRASEFAQTFGLDEKQVTAALSSNEVKSAIEIAQIGIELTKNNPEAMKAFAEKLARTMGRALGFSPEQIEKGIQSGALTVAGTTAPTGSAKEAVDAFATIVNKTGGFATPADRDAFMTSMIKYRDTAAGMDPNKISGIADSGENRALLSSASARLKARGVSDAIQGSNLRVFKVGDPLFGGRHDVWNATQKGADYGTYAMMISKGLVEADAKAALRALLGDHRAAAALALGGEG